MNTFSALTRQELKDTIGGFVSDNTPHPINDVGAKHLGDYLVGNRISVLPNASPYLMVREGEAFGYKNLGQATQLIARMLRPYKPIVQVEGHIPHEFANNIINSLVGKGAIVTFKRS